MTFSPPVALGRDWIQGADARPSPLAILAALAAHDRISMGGDGLLIAGLRLVEEWAAERGVEDADLLVWWWDLVFRGGEEKAVPLG